MAGLVLSFIACFILLVIAPLGTQIHANIHNNTVEIPTEINAISMCVNAVTIKYTEERTGG